MSRPHESRKKVDVGPHAAPLQFNPFAALDEVEALKHLPQPKPERTEAAAPPTIASPRKILGRLVLRRETKDRGGKVVVVISGFAEVTGSSAVLIANLAKELKGKLGCGGSFDRQEIVLQGDRCAQVCALLEGMGYRVAGVRS